MKNHTIIYKYSQRTCVIVNFLFLEKIEKINKTVKEKKGIL
jgi:hypothetical protein